MKFSVLALMTLMIFGTVAPAQAQRISSEVGEKGRRVVFSRRRGHYQRYREDREYYPQYRRVRHSRRSRRVRGDNPRYRSRGRSRVVRGDNRENCSGRTRYFPRGYEKVYYR